LERKGLEAFLIYFCLDMMSLPPSFAQGRGEGEPVVKVRRHGPRDDFRPGGVEGRAEQRHLLPPGRVQLAAL